MPKISETLQIAGGNLSRPTRFTAMIAPPAGVLGEVNSKVFDVLCKNIKVPDMTMEPIDIQYKGHTVKIPSRVNQDQTIELTMYLDENHYLRSMFHNWIAGIDPRFYGRSSSASANMVHSGDIFGNLMIKARDFNETTQEIQNYLIEGIYPISVSGPEYGSANLSEISEFTVTLAYYRFLSGDTSGAYDDVDNFLDIMGASPISISGIGSIDNLLNSGVTAMNSTTKAFNAISNIF